MWDETGRKERQERREIEQTERMRKEMSLNDK